MPTIPVYGGQQVSATPLRPAMQGNIDVSSGTQSIARGLDTVGDAIGQMVQRDASQQAFDAHARLQQDWMAFDADARTKYRGQNVDQYKAETDKWWAEAPEKYGKDLNPLAKNMASRAMLQTQTQAKGSSLSYWNGEKERATDEAAAAAKGSEVQFAITTGTPEAIEVSKQKIAGINADTARRKGWTTEQLQQENLKDVSAMHTSLVNKLLGPNGDPTKAQAYFDANKGEILAPQQAALSERLNTVVAANDGHTTAQEVWTKSGPKSLTDAVNLSEMSAEVREKYKNDKPRRDAALSALRELTQEHNVQQTENAAQGTNSAWATYNRTHSLAAMKRDPGWALVPAAQQAQIETAILNQQTASLSRDEAAIRRHEAQQMRTTSAAFHDYMDPEKLAKMSRAQVQALEPVLGRQYTGQLLDRFDTLSKSPLAVKDATIDHNDMLSIMQEMGLKPYAKNKTEEGKATLGVVQSRLERALTQAQQAAKRPLTREEKNTLVREEIAKTVSVADSFLGLSLTPDTVPVAELDADQLQRVIVPPQHIGDIRTKMRILYEDSNGRDPRYQPTEENLRRFYLQHYIKSNVVSTIPSKNAK